MQRHQWVAIDLAVRNLLAPSDELNGWLTIKAATESEVPKELASMLYRLHRHGDERANKVLPLAPDEVFGTLLDELRSACGNPFVSMVTQVRLLEVIHASWLAGVIQVIELVEWDDNREYRISVAA